MYILSDISVFHVTRLLFRVLLKDWAGFPVKEVVRANTQHFSDWWTG